MKSIFNWGSLSAAALGLLLLPTAHAQTTTTPTYGIGTCTSSTDMNVPLAGTSQLKVAGTLIPAANANAVFNLAECQCNSTDIDMHFTLTQGVGTSGAIPAAQMWIGQSDCGDPSMRATKQCDPGTSIAVPNKPDGSLFRLVGMFDITVPPAVVTNPRLPTSPPGTAYQCQTTGVTNPTITVTVGPDVAPAICTMPVSVTTVGPVAPGNVSVTTGDSGLVVSWSVPPLTGGIENYQVLCRKTAAPTVPVMSTDFLNSNRYYFSSCINNTLFRRWPGGMKIENDPATSVGKVPISGGAFPIDPRLRCSDHVFASTTDLSTRISGLTNGEDYELMVVAIDSFGNATASPVVTGTPQPSAAVGGLDKYCEGSSCPGFGCQASRGGPLTGGAGTVAAALIALGLLVLERRARRAA